MKIRADKIHSNPPHGIDAKELRIVLENLPKEWSQIITDVRITNSLSHKGYAYFHQYDGSLTVFSRGSTKRETIYAVLLEFAAHSIGESRNFGIHISSNAKSRLAPYLKQYTEAFLAKLAGKMQHTLHIGQL